MNGTTSAIEPPAGVEPAPVAEWQDDYNELDKKTTFAEDWGALLSAISPRLAKHGRNAAIIWPLTVLALVVGMTYAFSDRVDWQHLPIKGVVLGLTLALATLYWPHRIVRYFNLDGNYARPASVSDATGRRLRFVYKIWVGLLVLVWIAIAILFATAPVTPDMPKEGRLTTVVELLLFLSLMALLPFLLYINNRKKKAKQRKHEKEAETAPKTFAEARAIEEAEVEELEWPWLLSFIRFRYRIYSILIPEDEATRRYRVRTWGKRNAHRRFVGPIARAYDWVMAWVLFGIGWLVFGSLAWVISQIWFKIKGFAEHNLWHWITAHL